MTNELVVVINSLKVPKIKKSLLYEVKFLVPNYSCLQNPWIGGYSLQIPVVSVLCSELNLLNPPPTNKIPGYATDVKLCCWEGRFLSFLNVRKCQPYTPHYLNLIQKYSLFLSFGERCQRQHTCPSHKVCHTFLRVGMDIIHSSGTVQIKELVLL